MKTNYVKMIGSFMLLALVAVMPSCTKDDGGSVSLSGTASLQIVNAAEGSGSQDFFLDNSKVNSSAVAYTQSSGYMTTSAGNHTGEFRATGTSTASASSSMIFETGKYYTVYLGGSGSSSSVVTTQDDMTAPAAGKARVRFVHLSSAVTSGVDVAVSGGAKLVSGLAYKAASAYSDVDASTAFTLAVAGSSTAVLTIPSFLQAGKIYTVYISGATLATVSFHSVTQN